MRVASSGTATVKEIAGLINERTESVDNAQVNALMHPELVQKSADGVAKGFEKFQADNLAAEEAAKNPMSVDAIVDRLMDGEMAGDVLSEYSDYFKEFDITSQTDTSIRIQLTQGQEINLFKP